MASPSVSTQSDTCLLTITDAIPSPTIIGYGPVQSANPNAVLTGRSDPVLPPVSDNSHVLEDLVQSLTMQG